VSIEGAKQLAAELAAIKRGAPKPVYLVFGSEAYLVRGGADALAASLAAASSAEIVRVDAEGKSAAALLEPLTSLSLFATARVSVVRNFGHLLAGDAADVLLRGIESGLAPGSALLFVAVHREGSGESRVDKRGRGYKGLSKLGAVLEFGDQSPEAVAGWLREKAAGAGKKITPEAVSLLLLRCGTDMETLGSELDKAILYCLDQESIGAADLERLVVRSREEAVWEITEAVLQRDPRRALALMDDLLAAGTYPLVLMTLIVRQARHLLQARLLWEEAGRPAFRDVGGFTSKVAGAIEPGRFGRGADDVTTIHPYASFKRFDAAARYDLATLRRMLARVRLGDRDAKSGGGAGARETLEEMILDLCAMSPRARHPAREAA
jgi:DNA polymerase-3 subunit delta